MPNEKKIDSIRESKRPFKVLDIAVFIVLTLSVVFIIVFSFSKDANYIEIRYQGSVQRYLINIDREITVKEGYVVVIKDSECYVKQTDCDDKTCKHTGKIKKVNQMIVCAPYGITIKVVGEITNQV